MAKESYIHFHYNYDNHERAMQSSLLLNNLLQEKVSFTVIPDKDDFPFPVILIKTPEREIPSRYQVPYLYDSGIFKNFKNQCRNIRESSLEKGVHQGIFFRKRRSE